MHVEKLHAAARRLQFVSSSWAVLLQGRESSSASPGKLGVGLTQLVGVSRSSF